MNVGLTVAILVHLATFFVPFSIFLSIPGSYVTLSLSLKLFLCLMPNMGLYFALDGKS